MESLNCHSAGLATSIDEAEKLSEVIRNDDESHFYSSHCHTECLHTLKEVYMIILKQNKYYPLNIQTPQDQVLHCKPNEEFNAHLPNILKKIQIIWLDKSEDEGIHSSGEWAMERFMEVLIKNIGKIY